MNGFVLCISGFATSATHSASNGSAALSDFARLCSEGARRGDGDTFFTIWPSHCSGLGSGDAVSIGTTTLEEVDVLEAPTIVSVVTGNPPLAGIVTAVLLLLVLLPILLTLWVVLLLVLLPRADKSSVCCLFSGDIDRGGIVGTTDKDGRAGVTISLGPFRAISPGT